MPNTLTRRALIGQTAACASIPLWGTAAFAAPQPFQLIAARSQVGFSVTSGNDRYDGTMPVNSASLALDFQNVAGSEVSVTLRAADARMGALFAAEGLKSSAVLDTARHPNITFQSTRVGAGASRSEAVLTGRVTVKGVTQPLTLNARLSQDAATLNDANPELTLTITGAVDRHDFGASGFSGLVDPLVQLRIIARIKRA